MKEKIEEIKKAFRAEIEKAALPEDIEAIRVKYLGRKGEIAKITKSLPTLPQEEIAKAGRSLNELKKEAQALLNEKTKSFAKASSSQRYLFPFQSHKSADPSLNLRAILRYFLLQHSYILSSCAEDSAQGN